jgi:hypothetical protein
VILSKRIEEKDEEIETMESEQKILRGMATSGIVTASFSHELGNLSDVLISRTDELVELLESKSPQDIYQNVEDFLNPYAVTMPLVTIPLKIFCSLSIVSISSSFSSILFERITFSWLVLSLS